MNVIKIFIFLIIIPAFVAGQVGNDSLTLLNLPKIRYDYKKCVVTIKADNPEQWRATNKLAVLVTITNNSEDTLKYGMWSYDFLNYSVDNKDLQIDEGSDILKNVVNVFTTPPRKENTFRIELTKRKGIGDFHGKFRINFHLMIERGNEIDNEYILNTNGEFIKLPDADLKSRSHWVSSNTIKI